MTSSLAELFSAVKAEQKNNKGKVVISKRVKSAQTPVLDVDDEWSFTDTTNTIVVEAIEYQAEARVVLKQPWQCVCCGNAGQNQLGLFVRERSTRTRTVRWRNVGVTFDYAALGLPAAVDWLEPEQVGACERCAEDTSNQHQQTFDFGETSAAALAPLVQEIVESMLVAKPGFDEHGRRVLSPNVCTKPMHDSVTGELIGFVEDKREQEVERLRAEARRFG